MQTRTCSSNPSALIPSSKTLTNANEFFQCECSNIKITQIAATKKKCQGNKNIKQGSVWLTETMMHKQVILGLKLIELFFDPNKPNMTRFHCPQINNKPKQKQPSQDSLLGS
jgi:hypothetical protein